MGHAPRMRAFIGGGLVLVVLALGGCREVVLDPASRHAAPLVDEESDAAFDEDAATPPPVEVAPIPYWAREDAPPPAFPPPPTH